MFRQVADLGWAGGILGGDFYRSIAFAVVSQYLDIGIGNSGTVETADAREAQKP